MEVLVAILVGAVAGVISWLVALLFGATMAVAATIGLVVFVLFGLGILIVNLDGDWNIFD